MSKKNLYRVLILFLLCIGIAGSIGFYFFNKGPLDIKQRNGIKVEAKDLYNLYSTDSILAKKTYTGKILQVSGEVVEVTTNAENIKVITLNTGIPGASINCTMDELNEKLVSSKKVEVKGICSGIGEEDPDLGVKADIYLSRCILVK